MTTLSPLFSWRSAIAQSDLPAPARHIALTLTLFMNEMGASCWPSISKQCEATGLARATVCKYLELLEEKGWIKREKGGKGKSTHYIACIPEVVRETDYTGGEVVREVNGGSPSGELNHVIDHDKDLNLPAAAPQEKFSKPEIDLVWNALVKVTGFDPSGSTEQERRDFGKSVTQLRAVIPRDATAAEMEAAMSARRRAWDREYPDARLTHRVLRGKWTEIGALAGGDVARPPCFAFPVDSEGVPVELLSVEDYREWRRSASPMENATYQQRFDVADDGLPA